MKSIFLCLIVCGLFFTAMGCGTSDPLWNPSLLKLSDAAPDSFDVAIVTSSGKVDVRLYRKWSPLGVDRAFYLFENNFYAGVRFYRVIEGFIAQFGGSGDVRLDSIWRELSIRDEPVRQSNKRGTISFARGGPQSRSMTMFINLVDNARLDSIDFGGAVGFPPIGRIVGGMNVVDSLYSGYGPAPMKTNLSSGVLAKEYPRLDSIAATSVTRMW
jgi:peptidyl-prolyl cis-trans isomerase A (cyclophilin A)